MRSLAAAAVALAAVATARADGLDWTLVDTIAARIQPPAIPQRPYRVAGPADGRTDARPAIRAAIEKASREGGGRVLLAKGTWLSNGPVELKSRIELHLEEGARLLFSPEPAHYLPVVKTRWEGTEVMTYSPLVY